MTISSLISKDDPAADWSAFERRFAMQVLENVKHYKRVKKLTAKALTEKLETVGWPININTLNGMLGKKGRGSISITEVMALARALDVPPAFLVIPLTRVSEVELFPQDVVPAHDAYNYFAGKLKPPIEWDIDDKSYRNFSPFTDENVVLDALQRHQTAMRELTRLTAWWLGLRQVQAESDAQTGKEGRDRNMALKPSQEAEWAEDSKAHLQSLSDARLRLRSKNVEPPPIPPVLKFVDDEPLPDVPLPLHGLASEDAISNARDYVVKQYLK